MKLFLTSESTTDIQRLINLTDKDATNIRVAYIPNASDLKSERDKLATRQRTIDEFSLVGIAVSTVDLLTENEVSLSTKLNQYDIIWVSGGNIHYLRELMHSSGFDKAVINLRNSDIVYGGNSAGAMVAGPTLEYYDQLLHEPAPENATMNGLNLTDIIVLPHHTHPRYAGNEIECANKAEQAGYKVELLKDGEALVIDGASVERL